MLELDVSLPLLFLCTSAVFILGLEYVSYRSW